jgi:hypothetical protein
MAIELTTATTEQLQGIRGSLGAPTIFDMFPNASFQIRYIDGTLTHQISWLENGGTIDFKNCQKMRTISLGSVGLTTILNASDLTNLEDLGTAVALNVQQNSFSASTLNQLFTDLPATNKTATIDVRNTNGAATCDPTIATNKGYTVITS